MRVIQDTSPDGRRTWISAHPLHQQEHNSDEAFLGFCCDSDFLSKTFSSSLCNSLASGLIFSTLPRRFSKGGILVADLVGLPTTASDMCLRRSELSSLLLGMASLDLC